MMTCYKCGYKYYGDRDVKICPICGTNLITPKYAAVLFLAMVSFIFFTFISVFNHKFDIISQISLIVAFITLPLAISEAGLRLNEVQDGFRIPDYPSEIINGETRVPDFRFFNHIEGLPYGEGVKRCLFEVHDDGLNYYHNKLGSTIGTIDYTDIVGLDLQNKNELQVSATKSIIGATLLGALGGIGVGLAGGILGGIKNKEYSVLEIQTNQNSIYITSDRKCDLEKLVSDIKDKIEGY